MTETLLKTDHTEVIKVGNLEMIKRPVACAMLAIDKDGDVIMVEQDRGHFGKFRTGSCCARISALSRLPPMLLRHGECPVLPGFLWDVLAALFPPFEACG